RMRLEWISAAESVKFAQVMNEFTQRITELGANRRLVDIRNITDAEEKMSASGSATTPVGANCVRPPHYADVAQTEEQMRKRAIELLNSGEVNRILAWKKGDFEYYPEPSFFTTAEEIEQDFVYNRFCAANLTKYLMAAPWLGGRQFEGKTAIFLKPCDSHSFNRLLEENLANREKTHIIGVACGGNVYVEEMEEIGLLEKCQVCEKTEHAVFDEVIGEVSRNPSKDRMEMVDALDAMTGEERFAFWQEQLSKCIRCNACRNTCPVCNCKKCVFSGDNYDMVSKVNTTEFEGQMFHAVRAFHVAGRCSDCGECSRTCPQDIPIHLLNRKLIKVDMQKGE
ncbi:MAG: 4Fe-4S dicluster domain-containing protein, partial [Defluviitaleaceae bacterium]|nr:4Fe-4S dicluster domain-containing protein [Defluviitaleaceae bacterium]